MTFFTLLGGRILIKNSQENFCFASFSGTSSDTKTGLSGSRINYPQNFFRQVTTQRNRATFVFPHITSSGIWQGHSHSSQYVVSNDSRKFAVCIRLGNIYAYQPYFQFQIGLMGHSGNDKVFSFLCIAIACKRNSNSFGGKLS